MRTAQGRMMPGPGRPRCPLGPGHRALPDTPGTMRTSPGRATCTAVPRTRAAVRPAARPRAVCLGRSYQVGQLTAARIAAL